MAVRNVDIAAIFSEIADLLDIENANPFRIRAYRNAAWLVGDLGEDIQAIIASERGLSGLLGIGSDLPDSILARLDLVVGAVHSRFDLARARQTERIMKAMDHRYFTLLAHPSGRLIGQREPYDVDMARLIAHARSRGCCLEELNAHPERLDLLDTWCMAAKAAGVLIAIDSDAHSVREFANLRFGIGQARRGWLSAENVLSTRPLAELRQLLRH